MTDRKTAGFSPEFTAKLIHMFRTPIRPIVAGHEAGRGWEPTPTWVTEAKPVTMEELKTLFTPTGRSY